MTAHLPPNALFAQPSAVARGIFRAIETRRDVVYVPAFWALIMLIIRAVPGRIFKKLNL
jgi:short-subunit dehydrogenase